MLHLLFVGHTTVITHSVDWNPLITAVALVLGAVATTLIPALVLYLKSEVDKGTVKSTLQATKAATDAVAAAKPDYAAFEAKMNNFMESMAGANTGTVQPTGPAAGSPGADQSSGSAPTLPSGVPGA